MENVILIVHLILAAVLIGVVLMQRSEGGGLGIGGGGGGAVSGRSAATALSKVTWMLAIAFFATSMTLTIIAARNAQGDSVIERSGIGDGDGDAPASIPLPADLQGDLTPPTITDEPAAPPTPE